MASKFVPDSFAHNDRLRDIESKNITLVKCFLVNIHNQTQREVMIQCQSHLLMPEKTSLNAIDIAGNSVYVSDKIAILNTYNEAYYKKDKFTFSPYFNK